MDYRRIAVVLSMLLWTPVGTVVRGQVLQDGQYWFANVTADYTVDPVDPIFSSGEAQLTGNHWEAAFHTTNGSSESDETMSVTLDTVTPVGNGYLQITGTESGGEPFASLVAVCSAGLFEVTRDTSDQSDIGMTVNAHRAVNPSMLGMGGNWNLIGLQTGVETDPAGSCCWAETDHGIVTVTPTSETQGTGVHTDYDGGNPSDSFDLELDRTAAKVTVSGPDVHVSGYVGVIREDMMMHVDLGNDSEPESLGIEFLFRQTDNRSLAEVVGLWNLQGLCTSHDLREWNASWGTLTVLANGTFHIDFEGDALGHEPGGSAVDGTLEMSADGWITARDGGEPDDEPVLGMLNLAGDTMVLATTDEENAELYIATRALVPEPSSLGLLLVMGLGLLIAGRRGRRR